MNIIYLLDEDISKDTGVVKKIKSKIAIWETYGHTVQVISIKSDSFISVLKNSLIVSKYNKEYGFIKKSIEHYKSINKLSKVLNKIEKIDLIYTRLIRFSPNLKNTLTKHSKYIIEINTNDVEEFKLGSKLSYFFHALTRNSFFSNSSAFVSVSHELAEHEYFTKFNKQTIVIANGYNFQSNYKPKKEDSNNKKCRCVFIGSPKQGWHGLDKIISLAKQLYDIEFHIIGTDKKSLSKIAIDIPNNLLAYGYLNSDKAIDIIRSCDIGISTLALHRNNMNEASPLKSREYLANGLPIIIGYKDSDLVENEYILNIGNYEDNVNDNIDIIYKFCMNARHFSNQKIINETKKLLSYENKEHLRIKFFENIIC